MLSILIELDKFQTQTELKLKTFTTEYMYMKLYSAKRKKREKQIFDRYFVNNGYNAHVLDNALK